MVPGVQPVLVPADKLTAGFSDLKLQIPPEGLPSKNTSQEFNITRQTLFSTTAYTLDSLSGASESAGGYRHTCTPILYGQVPFPSLELSTRCFSLSQDSNMGRQLLIPHRSLLLLPLSNPPLRGRNRPLSTMVQTNNTEARTQKHRAPS